ncbi:hypothetical protein [Inhella proteolytica]|uniref:Uncharacterized protein n=1 Tax=Inhella proteolytica TaxID=2795029 RepID=A0A931J7B4_9BURK|nr:hypothetical protein [Inhella proteolytica]MBH9578142.1 hypothetical protein [Inhella proteolytica]
MPVTLHTVGLKHTPLAGLPAHLQLTGFQLVEPLGARPWNADFHSAFFNLAVCLEALAERVPPKGRKLLIGEASKARTITEHLPAQAPCEGIALADQPSLWPIVASLKVDAAGSGLLALIGAAYLQVAQGGAALGEPFLQALLQASAESQRGCPDTLQAAVGVAYLASGRLLQRVHDELSQGKYSHRSAKSTMAEAKVEKRWCGQYRIDVAGSLAGISGPRALTLDDVKLMAERIYQKATDGHAGSVTTALAHWVGIDACDLVQIPIFAQGPGLIRLDRSGGQLLIDLSGVLVELAKTAHEAAQPTSDVLRLPLLKWMAEQLRYLRAANPAALCLSDLPGLRLPREGLQKLHTDLGLADRFTAPKFVKARALPLLSEGTDPLVTALACLDFSRAPKVAFAYPCISAVEVLQAQARRAELLSWGPLAPSSVSSQGYLSKVSAPLSSIARQVEVLRQEVEASRPGPNSGLDKLISHHQAMVTYCAYCFGLALCLRAQKTTLLPAQLLDKSFLRGWTDKATSDSRSTRRVLPVGATLTMQLHLLREHYQSLRGRLVRLQGKADLGDALGKLDRVLAGDPESELLVGFKGHKLEAYTPLTLVERLGGDWVGNRDALRHAVPELLMNEGASLVEREAFMRHAMGEHEVLCGGSSWSVEAWRNHAGRLQDILLRHVGVQAIGGLICSLGRTL